MKEADIGKVEPIPYHRVLPPENDLISINISRDRFPRRLIKDNILSLACIKSFII